MDLFFRWATPVVQRGYTQEQLQTEDLLPLPPTATPRACTADLWNQWSKVSLPLTRQLEPLYALLQY
jgi:hypothetical protein